LPNNIPVSGLLNIDNQGSQVVPVTPDSSGDGEQALNIISSPSRSGQSYVDITEYLNMPQSEASKKLGIPTSTLSKRWKEAVR